MLGCTSLLPVELRHANHTASTNGGILRLFTPRNPTIAGCMATLSTTDQIAERVERLLLRHAELQRTNALLADQVAALTQERDSLKSRLSAARERVDALLERLPAAAPAATKDAE
jgi:FtsZ-binding cell division protein ZapB